LYIRFKRKDIKRYNISLNQYYNEIIRKNLQIQTATKRRDKTISRAIVADSFILFAINMRLVILNASSPSF